MTASDFMRGFPPSVGQRVDLETWDQAPANRWSFRNVRAVLPTQPVRASRQLRLPRAEQRLEELALPLRDQRAPTLGALLTDVDADACLVLHRGRIVFERYYDGMGPRDLHLSQSVSKSLVGTLVGLLESQGLLDLEAPLSRYVPELESGGYAGATLHQVLDMRSGVKFGEDYSDPECEVGQLDRASGWKTRREGDPASIYDLIVNLTQERPHGGPFRYRSIETDVLGWVLERASGLGLADLLSRELWQPMGAEAEACFTVDRAGTCLADGGLSACLRDYARFGQLYCNEGAIGGRQVLPAAWVAACRSGDIDAFQETPNPAFFDLPQACYSRQWWVLDAEEGVIAALGIFGQMIYVDPRRECVVTLLSSWPDAMDTGRRRALLRACETIARSLSA
ncbi:MAG: serine hydrolase [Rhodospirillales bacterium]